MCVCVCGGQSLPVPYYHNVRGGKFHLQFKPEDQSAHSEVTYLQLGSPAIMVIIMAVIIIMFPMCVVNVYYVSDYWFKCPT